VLNNKIITQKEKKKAILSQSLRACEICEFKAPLVYIASSRTAKSTERDLVSEKQK